MSIVQDTALFAAGAHDQAHIAAADSAPTFGCIRTKRDEDGRCNSKRLCRVTGSDCCASITGFYASGARPAEERALRIFLD
jgi:hypothetical protein